MNVDKITMPARVAREHHKDYVAAVRKHQERRRAEADAKAKAAGKALGEARIEKSRFEKEDEELMKLYYALSQGDAVISLPQVFRKSGVDPKEHLPVLAFAEADAEHCAFAYGFERQPVFYWKSGSAWSDSNSRSRLRLAADTFPAETSNEQWRRQNHLKTYPVRATVPIIPPALRPDDLEGYYILWEAVWEKKAPVDPILLKRVTSTTYAIVAQWDLTPAEQMVIDGRFS